MSRFSSVKKGQSSVEYILIVGLALMMIVPVTMMFLRFSTDSQDSLLHSQIYKAGNQIVDGAELMYSVGENSWQTVEFSLPETISGLTVYTDNPKNELVLTYDVQGSSSDAVFFSSVPLLNATSSDCSDGCSIFVHPGINKLRVKSLPGGAVAFEVVK